MSSSTTTPPAGGRPGPSTSPVSLVVPLPADVYNRLYLSAAAANRPIDHQALLKLRAALTLLPDGGGRVVTLSGDTLTVVETILGGGSILNQEDLLAKVERLAGVSFEHCRLPFSPSQLEALQEKATRQGLTVQQIVERTAPRIYEQFFDLIARS